jgi:hypothetical protein
MVQKDEKWLYIHHGNHINEASTTKMDVNELKMEKMIVENQLVTIQD